MADQTFADLWNESDKPAQPKENAFQDLWDQTTEVHRGVLGDIVSGALRGAFVQLPQLVGQGIRSVAPETGEAISNLGKDLEKNHPILQPSEEEKASMVRRGVTGSFENIPSSAAIPMAGAAIGTAIAPGIGTLVGGGIGTALNLGLFFGRQYNETMDEARAQGKNPDEVRPYALLEGAIESGGELLSDVIGFETFGLGKLVSGGVKKATLRNALMPTLKRGLVSLAEAIPGEVGTEVGQDYFEALIHKKLGLETPEPGQAALEAILPTLGMTVLMGGGAHVTNMIKGHAIQNVIEKPLPENLTGDLAVKAARTRTGIVDMMANAMAKDDTLKEYAPAWREYAENQVAQNLPIDIDMPFDKISLDATNLENQITQEMGLKQRELNPQAAMPREENYAFSEGLYQQNEETRRQAQEGLRQGYEEKGPGASGLPVVQGGPPATPGMGGALAVRPEPETLYPHLVDRVIRAIEGQRDVLALSPGTPIPQGPAPTHPALTGRTQTPETQPQGPQGPIPQGPTPERPALERHSPLPVKLPSLAEQFPVGSAVTIKATGKTAIVQSVSAKAKLVNVKEEGSERIKPIAPKDFVAAPPTVKGTQEESPSVNEMKQPAKEKPPQTFIQALKKWYGQKAANGRVIAGIDTEAWKAAGHDINDLPVGLRLSKEKGGVAPDEMTELFNDKDLPALKEGELASDKIFEAVQNWKQKLAVTVDELQKAADNAIVELEAKYGKDAVRAGQEEIERSVNEEVAGLSDEDVFARADRLAKLEAEVIVHEEDEPENKLKPQKKQGPPQEGLFGTKSELKLEAQEAEQKKFIPPEHKPERLFEVERTTPEKQIPQQQKTGTALFGENKEKALREPRTAEELKQQSVRDQKIKAQEEENAGNHNQERESVPGRRERSPVARLQDAVSKDTNIRREDIREVRDSELTDRHRKIIAFHESLGQKVIFFEGTETARIAGMVLGEEPNTVYINTKQGFPEEASRHEAIHALPRAAYRALLEKLQPLFKNVTEFNGQYQGLMRDLGERQLLSSGRLTEELVAELATGDPGYNRYVTDPAKAKALIDEAFSKAQKQTEKQAVVRETVSRTVDTAKAEDQNLGGAGWVENGVIHAFHVTDNPEPVVNQLNANKPITEGRREGAYGDLGRGLYASGSPQIWTNRSTGKWSFLENLSKEQLNKLVDAVQNHPNVTESNYLSQYEKERLQRDTEYIREGKLSPDVLTQFSGQPYNITLWQPDFLEKLGIEPGKQPQEIPVELKGKFAELKRYITQEEADALKTQGYDGAFIKGGFSSTQQLVVWNNDAIQKFGGYNVSKGQGTLFKPLPKFKILPDAAAAIDRNTERMLHPLRAYAEDKEFRDRFHAETSSKDIGFFKKWLWNPFFKGQKFREWADALGITERQGERRNNLNERYIVRMAAPFFRMRPSSEAVKRIEKAVIHGDATLPYKYMDLLKKAKEAMTPKDEALVADLRAQLRQAKAAGEDERVNELKQQLKQANRAQETDESRALKAQAAELKQTNGYTDAELRNGVRVESRDKNGRVTTEVVKLSPEEIQAYRAIRTTYDTMYKEWLDHISEVALRPWEGQVWHPVLQSIYGNGKLGAILSKITAKKEVKEEDMASLKEKLTAAGIADEDMDEAIKKMAAAYSVAKGEMTVISKLRNQLGRWIAYFPRVRDGNYYAEVTKMEPVLDKKGNPVLNQDGTPKMQRVELYNQAYDHPWQGRAIEQNLKANPEFAGAEIRHQRKTRESDTSFQGVADRNLMRLLTKALESTEGRGVENTDEMRKSMINALVNELKARGFGTRAIKRKGYLIKGYQETGLQRIMFDTITSFTGGITKQDAAMEFVSLIGQIREAKNKPQLFEDISTYAKDMLRNQDTLDRISGKMRAWAYIMYLGGNLKSALVQLTQNYVTGIPMLQEYLRQHGKGGVGMAELLYHRAMYDIARTRMDDQGRITKSPLTDIERQFEEEFLSSGIAQDQMIREMTGRMRGRLGEGADKISYYLSYPFSRMEIFNRMSAGLTMFRIVYQEGLQKGLDKDAAYKEAFDAARTYTYKTHYMMGKGNLPRIASGGDLVGVGARTAFTFRSFTHNYLLSMVNSGDWRTIAHSLAYVTLFGGMLALPFMRDFFDLVERWTGYSPLKAARQTMRDYGGKTLETFGTNGLPALAYGNISGSLSIGIPFVGAPSDTIYGVWGQLLGTRPGLIADAFQRRDVYRAVENMMPEAVANPMRAMRMSEIGKEAFGTPGMATTNTGKIMWGPNNKPMQLSPGEVAAKTIGFQPTGYAAESEARRSVSNVETYFQDRRTEINEAYRVARTEHDQAKVKAVLEDIKEYNQDIRSRGAQGVVTPIKLSQVIANAKPKPTKKQLREARYERAYAGE